MNILFVAAEAAPLVKVGGLADVVGALPKALVDLGHQVSILLPNYDVIDHIKNPAADTGLAWTMPWLGVDMAVHLLQGQLPGTNVAVLYLDCPPIFQTKNVPGGLQGVYANSDDPLLYQHEFQRFLFFSLAAVEAIQRLPSRPDIIHCHDWHTALVPLAAKLKQLPQPTVLTIHNLQNQGRWSADEVLGWLGLSGQEGPALQKRDRLGNLNFLQLGINTASAVNTVSPNYAKEILTAEYGETLEDDLVHRSPPVLGILNGIDTGIFNPATDQALPIRYDQGSWRAGKLKNKAEIQHQLGLAPNGAAPLFVSVGRLTPQKGFDLVTEIIPDIVAAGGQVALLGSGLPTVEAALQAVADTHRSSVSLTLGFDAALAQRMYAAGDFFLMPSRFEPCGLGQMIAMRYGALPIVRDTGGLHDSVIDVVTHPENGTGLVFGPYTADAFRAAVTAALQLYGQPDIVDVVQRAMAQDFSWQQSALQYQTLYGQIKNNT